MIRIEFNIITGERIEIAQKAYSDGASIIIIDATDLPPDGFEELLDPIPTGPTIDDRKALARLNRDDELKNYYDLGVAMCLRGIRMTTDPEKILYFNAKLAELDIYAVELQAVPEQPGFPDIIDWPSKPTQ